jgi:hypothetical protein
VALDALVVSTALSTMRLDLHIAFDCGLHVRARQLAALVGLDVSLLFAAGDLEGGPRRGCHTAPLSSSVFRLGTGWLFDSDHH